jgi:putative DNA primase/helicase
VYERWKLLNFQEDAPMSANHSSGLFASTQARPRPNAPGIGLDQRELVTQFQNALDGAGLGTPDILADGQIHRFRLPDDKVGALSGWYLLHLDGVPNGAAGDWRQGREPLLVWRTNRATLARIPPTSAAEIERNRRQREAERTAAHARAAGLALELWRASPEALEHAYLTAKGIRPFGARLCRHNTQAAPWRWSRDLGGHLLVPLTRERRLMGLQAIAPDGKKWFPPGTAKRGAYYLVSSRADQDGRLYIAEGFATAATVHQLTQRPCAAAFDAGNLLPAAEALRARFPVVPITLVADNDRATELRTGRNPGVEAARRAAEAVGAELVIPDFTRAGVLAHG